MDASGFGRARNRVNCRVHSQNTRAEEPASCAGHVLIAIQRSCKRDGDKTKGTEFLVNFVGPMYVPPERQYSSGRHSSLIFFARKSMAGRVWIGVLIASLTFVGSVRATDVCGLARHTHPSAVGPLRLRGGGYSLGLRDSIMIAHSFKGEEFGPAQSMHGATYTVDVEFHVKELVSDPLSLGYTIHEGMRVHVWCGAHAFNCTAIRLPNCKAEGLPSMPQLHSIRCIVLPTDECIWMLLKKKSGGVPLHQEPRLNWVLDIGNGMDILKAVLAQYNFKNLDELFPGENTTTEFMCK